MNEFELRRRLGALEVERQPDHDLWPAIAARLDASATAAADAPVAPRRPSRYWGWAMAAGVALFALTGTVLSARHEARLAEQARAEAAGRVAAELASIDANYRGAEVELARISPAPAMSRAVPALENASATLQTAEAELRSSLAEDPRAEFLLDLLARAKSKQMALERMKRA